MRRIAAVGSVLPYLEKNLTPYRSGNADGPFASARISESSAEGDLVRDRAGSIYATAGFSIRKIVPGHAVRTLAGVTEYSTALPYQDGPGETARFGFTLGGLAVDDEGRVYVADTLNRRIRLITQSDWDADGVPNDAETAFPYLSGGDDGRADSDGDGLANAMEHFVGSHPADAGSALRPALSLENGFPRLSWPSRAGIVYLVEKSTDLVRWVPLTDSVRVGAGERLEWIHDEILPVGNGRVFFRVIPFLSAP
jgi:hypothetical protein